MPTTENNNQCIVDLLDYLGSRCPESRTNSDGFNIFKALGMQYKEVLTCRFLGALLDPHGNHGYGSDALRLFISCVLGETNDGLSDKAEVHLEEVISDNRRVDVVIYNGNTVYPIEVKIWAGDQDEQLQDYYRYFFSEPNHYNGKKIYYLTPTGWEPSSKSKGNLELEKEIQLLSFSKNIRKWLEELKKAKPNNTDVNGILKQYIEVIDEMCENADFENTVRQCIGLNENSDFVVTDRLKALIHLLATNGDTNSTYQQMIQIVYLKKKLKYDLNTYEIRDIEKDEKKKNGYARLKIMRKGMSEPIAFICIETNLYLSCCKERKSPCQSKKWHHEDPWAYLCPDGYQKEKYRLNDCKSILDEYTGMIEIDDLLEDIE